MSVHSYSTRRYRTGGLIVVLIAAMVSLALFALPSDIVLPAGIFSITSFFLAPQFFPRCRFYLRPLICPVNVLKGAFFLQLVIMPLHVRFFGELHFFLPRLPSDAATNLATVLITFAYWAFAAGINWKNNAEGQPLAVYTDPEPSKNWPLPTGLIITFSVIGLIGLAAKHKSIGGYITFLRSPALFSQAQDRGGASASLSDAVADFCCFFLALSFVMVWSRIIERGNATGRQSKIAGPLMLLPIAAAFASYNYNRGNFVFPLLAIAAGATIRAPQTLKRNLLLIGGAGAALVFATVIYRNSTDVSNIRSGPTTEALNRVDQTELFQLYGQAPQYIGIMLEAADYGAQPRFGLMSVSSAVALIPVIGKPVRLLSGKAFYSVVTGHEEENPPFVGEVYLDLNIFGVVGVYFLIGLAVAYLQRRVLTSRHVFEVYICQIVSIYLVSSVLLGIEELALFAIYSMFPINTYLIFRAFRLRLQRRRNNFVYRAPLQVRGY